MQHTYISSEHFQLGRRRNHARPGQRKFPCPRQESNSRPSGSVVGTSDKHVVFGGSWVQFSPGVRKFSLSRASMISPPSKLKMFTGSVCVLLTSVSLKLTKNRINLRNHEFVRKKQNGGWKLSFIFLFIVRVVFFFHNLSCYFFLFMIRVDPSPILFYFYFFIRSESIWVDPTRTGGLSWSGPTFVPALKLQLDMLQTVCMAGKNGLRLLVLPDWLFSGSMVQRSGSWLLAQKVVMV